MKFGAFYEHQLPRPWKDGDEHICESLKLFAREVMPEFAERDSARENEKRERFAPTVERALAPPPETPTLATPLPRFQRTEPAAPRVGCTAPSARL